MKKPGAISRLFHSCWLELIKRIDRFERVQNLNPKKPLGIESQHLGLLIIVQIRSFDGLVNHLPGGDQVDLMGIVRGVSKSIGAALPDDEG